MTALPTNRQSAILSGGGFSPWQAPLAALFGGLAAAGQPGGWNNFGPGVIQGSHNFQAQQRGMMQDQRAAELFKMQQEAFAAQQRRANQEEAQRQATIDSLNSLLNPQQSVPSGQPIAAMFGGKPSQPAPNQSALFGEYAGIPPHARQSAILSGYSEEVLKRGMGPDGTINLDPAGGGGLNDGAGVQQAYDGTQFQGQNAGGMEILGRRYTDDQLAALRTMVATDPDGVMKILQEGAFVEPDEEKLTDDQREYQFAVDQGYQGDFLQFITDQKRAGAQNTTVNVNTPKSILAGDQKLLEIGAEGFAQAQEVMPLFDIAKTAAESFDGSGTFGGAALFYERAKGFLGLPNDAAPGEVLQGMQTRLGTLLRVPGSGATSNMEMSLYMQGVPGLLNTQKGNVALATIGKKLVQRRMADYQKLQAYVEKNGTSVGYVPDETPILTAEEMQLLLGGGDAGGTDDGWQQRDDLPGVKFRQKP